MREVLSDRILAAGWLPRVNEATLPQVLAPVKAFLARHGWPLLATLSDKQGALAHVLQALWPDTPHQWCQSHYLRQAAAPLYDRDLVLKTDLRREVRQAIRTSLSQVAATATEGDFAPHLVTGVAVAEVPAISASVEAHQPLASPPLPPSAAPAAGPAGPIDGASSATAPDDGGLPCGAAPLLLAPIQLIVCSVSGLAAPHARPELVAQAQPASAEGVVQSYAQTLQQVLGRAGRAPWMLGGLTMYADLQALHDSLTRCLQVREEPHLRLWHTVLAQRLPAYAAGFAEVRQGQTWVAALRHALDEAALPTAATPGPGSAAVARQLAQALGPIADQPVTGTWLPTFRQHLLDLSERYWRGLFPCYDIVGLPRTNNDLEGLYGQTKRHIRR